MSNKTKDSTAAIRVACAIVFLIFVFCYVYFFQTDLLAYAQHVWSGGQTHWNAEIGATLFTVVLFIIYIGVDSLFRLPKRCSALSFFPSLMMLGAITSVNPRSDVAGMSVGVWTWVCCGLLVLYFFVARILSSYRPYETPLANNSLFSSVSWMNLGILSLLMLFTLFIGNSNRALHLQLKMERYIDQRQYSKVTSMKISKHDLTPSMIMLYAFALSKNGELAESFFEWPITGSSQLLLPNKDRGIQFSFCNYDNLWKHLGAVPRSEISDVKEFFKTLQRQKLAKVSIDDYLLISYLMDRNLDGFVKEIVHYYDFRTEEERLAAAQDIEKRRKKLAKVIGEKEASDSIRDVQVTPSGFIVKPLKYLPKHFREALVLYTHTRINRIVTYHDNVLDADYMDFLKVDRAKYSSAREHDNALSDAYSGTYWYYYNAR